MIKKLIAFLLIAGLITYLGILYGTPYYHYYGIKSDIEELAVLSNMFPKEMKQEIEESINYYGVPVKMSAVSIQRIKHRHYIISFSWRETANFLDLYERKYEFSIHADGSKG